MSDHDLFAAEEAALKAAELAHDCETLGAEVYRRALGMLISQFRRLVRESRRLILHSDRQERELNALNSKLTQLAAELDFKARHDPLTRALNRRAVIERAESLLQMGGVALIVLDIDHFKRINDEFGHPTGDAVIVELVERLRTVAPANAEIGRVGGEEFTVVLPFVELAEAEEIAESMRKKVASVPFLGPLRRVVTASFGVSKTPKGGNFDDAYARADAAQYEAKRGGRNAVVSDSTTQPLLEQS